MHAFGFAHILWLLGIAATAAVLAWLVRQQSLPERYVRIGLAIFLILGELQRYFHDGMHWPDGLPLNLCNITTWVAVLACFTGARWAAEYSYFAGFAGAGMALLTPDMGAEWPPRFFINHGGLIVTAAVLIYGRVIRLRPNAIWYSYAIFASYIGFVGLFDWIFKTNYAYLRIKPSVSVLSVMGPWPVYILAAGLLGLILFWMLLLLAPRPATPYRTPVLEQAEASRVEGY